MTPNRSKISTTRCAVGRPGAPPSCASTSAAAAFGPVVDGLVDPRPQTIGRVGRSMPPPADRATSAGTGCEVGAVERLLEQLLGALLADGLAAGESGAGEEDLLVEAEAGPTDEDEAGDGDGEGLVETGHDHGADPLQRALATPQRRPEPPGGALEQRAAEVHVDDVRVLDQHLRVEGDRLGGASGRAGCRGRG